MFLHFFPSPLLLYARISCYCIQIEDFKWHFVLASLTDVRPLTLLGLDLPKQLIIGSNMSVLLQQYLLICSVDCI